MFSSSALKLANDFVERIDDGKRKEFRQKPTNSSFDPMKADGKETVVGPVMRIFMESVL